MNNKLFNLLCVLMYKNYIKFVCKVEEYQTIVKSGFFQK